MNPFKNVFKSRKSASLDILSSFVRASKSASSISVETVDLDTTSNSEWSIDDDKQTVGRLDLRSSDTAQPSHHPPIQPDVEPNWSALPLVTFSREVYDAAPAKTIEVVSVVDLRKSHSSDELPYHNLVLAVVAELHEVLSLKLPRYLVALLSNYRYMNDSAGRHEEVDQIDLYLTNVQAYLDVIRTCDADNYQFMLHHCGKAVAVLASIMELVGRNASLDVFLLSFQRQMISAFDRRALGMFNVKSQYLDYLSRPDDQDSNNLELELADSRTQTEDTSNLIDSFVQTTDHFVTNAETAELEEQLAELRDTIEACQAQITDLCAENEDLRRHCTDFQQGCGDSSVNGVLRMAARVISGHTSDFGELIQRFSDQLTERVTKISGKVHVLREKRSVLARNFFNREKYLKRLLQEIVSRDSELSAALRQIAKLKAELVGQDSEIGTLHRSLSTISEESVSNGTRNADLEARVQALSDALSAEQARSEASISENTSLLQQIFILTEEVKRRHSDFSNAESKTQAMHNRAAELEADLQSRSETLALSQKENAALLERISHLETTRGLIEGTQHAFGTTMKKKDDMLRKLQAALQAAVADRNDLQSDVVELKNQRKLNLESLKTAESEKSDLLKTLSEKNVLVDTLENCIKKQRVEAANEAMRLNRAKQQSENLEMERTVLARQLAVTQAALAEERDKQSLMEYTVLSLNNQLANQSTQLADLQAKYQKALDDGLHQKMTFSAQHSESSQQLADECAAQKSQLDQACKRNEQLEQELSSLQSSFFHRESVSQQKADVIINELRDELRFLQDRFSAREHLNTGQTRPTGLMADVGSQTDCDRAPNSADEATIRTMQKQFEEQTNVIRALEYGKEKLNQRISGLEADSRTSVKRINELEQQLSSQTLRHDQQVEMSSKDHETKIRDALSRLAQKGEQLEFAKSSVEKLLKRQEEMSREIAMNVTLKNQAEQRMGRLADQSSRDIDELELQIKSLREQDQKNRTENQKIDAATATDYRELRAATVQTGLSFQYGYDLDSGRQIQGDIFRSQSAGKAVQTEWPYQPYHVGVQVNPLVQSAAVQASVACRAVPAQTDRLDLDGKFSQTDVAECRNVSSQTLFVHSAGLSTTSDRCPAIRFECGMDYTSTPVAALAVSDDLNSTDCTVNIPLSLPVPSLSPCLPSETVPTNLRTLIKHDAPEEPFIVQHVKKKRPIRSDFVKCLVDAATSVANFSTQRNLEYGDVDSVSAKAEDFETVTGDISATEPLTLDKSDQSDALSLASLISEPGSDVEDADDLSVAQTETEAVRHCEPEKPVAQVPPVKPCRTVDTIKAYEKSRARSATGSPVNIASRVTEQSSLHDICQFVYDAMLNNSATSDVLVDLSSGLDYTLTDSGFDYQFAEKFLETFDKLPTLRINFHRDGTANVAAVVSRMRALVRNYKSATLRHDKIVTDPIWKCQRKFERRNDRESTVELTNFFERIMASSLEHAAEGGDRHFDPRNPAVKNGRIAADQFSELEDFNNYFAQCFLRLSYASRNIRLVFGPVWRSTLRLPADQRAIRFAILALEFSRKSNKMREILSYEVNCDLGTFLHKYRTVLDVRLAGLPAGEARLIMRLSRNLFRNLFGFR